MPLSPLLWCLLGACACAVADAAVIYNPLPEDPRFPGYCHDGEVLVKVGEESSKYGCFHLQCNECTSPSACHHDSKYLLITATCVKVFPEEKCRPGQDKMPYPDCCCNH